MSGPQFITFGCRLNSFESELMHQHAAAAGLDDVVVIHTCAVTAEAERQARQAIRKARRAWPDARIVVTGCAAQIRPDAYAAMAEVDRVIGNQDKLRPELWQSLRMDGAVKSEPLSARCAEQQVDGLRGRSRAFVQVQNGCDHACTFCIIPQGRGVSRSVPAGHIVSQIRHLVERGYLEVVLTGVDLTSYGKDLPGTPSLGQLVKRILGLVPDLPRLRLSSLDPAELDPTLCQMIANEPRLMPHLHLSVQAGHDLTLKRMKRRHSRADVIEICERLRQARPEIAFGADLIAGFPTETEAMFAATLDLVAEADLTYLHVFPYSARAGTPAARMPQVPKPERKERAARLRAAGDRALGRFLARQVGTLAEMLVERDGAGHTDAFAPVRLEHWAGQPAAGSLARVALERVEAGMLVGQVAA